MKQQWKGGRQVRLKSGGPVMTVEPEGSNIDYVLCRWEMGRNSPPRDFNPAALEAAEVVGQVFEAKDFVAHFAAVTVGDVVWSDSLGCAVTVKDIPAGETVLCAWFFKNNRLKEESLYVTDLYGVSKKGAVFREEQ